MAANILLSAWMCLCQGRSMGNTVPFYEMNDTVPVTLQPAKKTCLVFEKHLAISMAAFPSDY